MSSRYDISLSTATAPKHLDGEALAEAKDRYGLLDGRLQGAFEARLDLPGNRGAAFRFGNRGGLDFIDHLREYGLQILPMTEWDALDTRLREAFGNAMPVGGVADVTLNEGGGMAVIRHLQRFGLQIVPIP